MSAGWPIVEAEGRYRPRTAGVQTFAADGCPHTAVFAPDLSFVSATEEGLTLVFRGGCPLVLPGLGPEPRRELGRLIATLARDMGRGR